MICEKHHVVYTFYLSLGSFPLDIYIGLPSGGRLRKAGNSKAKIEKLTADYKYNEAISHKQNIWVSPPDCLYPLSRELYDTSSVGLTANV